MLIRLVKMRFRAECVELFRAHFEQHRHQIRHFEGCLFLQVLQDTDDAQVWLTHSHWRSASDLEAYRRSDLFRGVWAQTRLWFESDSPPQAWSLEERYLVD